MLNITSTYLFLQSLLELKTKAIDGHFVSNTVLICVVIPSYMQWNQWGTIYGSRYHFRFIHRCYEPFFRQGSGEIAFK